MGRGGFILTGFGLTQPGPGPDGGMGAINRFLAPVLPPPSACLGVAVCILLLLLPVVDFAVGGMLEVPV